MYRFSFESYGVHVALDCDDRSTFTEAVRVIKNGLLGNLKELEYDQTEHKFKIEVRTDGLYLELNGDKLVDQGKGSIFFNYFDSWVRLVVAEHAKDLVFLHCGAVEINGKGVLFPGDSFAGKTTLVAEMVKRGATYYSDEYSVIDTEGMLHPFARLLAMRDRVDLAVRTDLSAESLGGIVGTLPVSVNAVLFLKYEQDAIWNPHKLSPGEGILRLLPQAIPLRFNSEFTLSALNKMSEGVTFVEGKRNSVENSVDKILELIDKI